MPIPLSKRVSKNQKPAECYCAWCGAMLDGYEGVQLETTDYVHPRFCNEKHAELWDNKRREQYPGGGDDGDADLQHITKMYDTLHGTLEWLRKEGVHIEVRQADEGTCSWYASFSYTGPEQDRSEFWTCVEQIGYFDTNGAM